MQQFSKNRPDFAQEAFVSNSIKNLNRVLQVLNCTTSPVLLASIAQTPFVKSSIKRFRFALKKIFGIKNHMVLKEFYGKLLAMIKRRGRTPPARLQAAAPPPSTSAPLKKKTVNFQPPKFAQISASKLVDLETSVNLGEVNPLLKAAI